ncbi:phage tail protein I [Pseudomonas gingeri]|uniref:phage tail protein I n=1 Tax=Pseudomonas gingeri TaxID=117681 RepID=UPI0015A41657|nr:phage tail protein I [Pseudomonas gingeri]NWD70767.1 phage tail protein I [Pseudomonas gingeri]
MTALSLLPRNATSLEIKATQALAQIQRVPIPLRQLCNPDTCPTPLLPYLAWAFSVDRWDSRWPESAKRAAIRAAYFVHSRKGTIGAVRRVVEPLGYRLDIAEWWETDPLGVPGTFKLVLDLPEKGDPEQAYDELIWLIDDAKPISRHLTELSISVEVAGQLYLSASSVDAEVIDVFPPPPDDIDRCTKSIRIGCEHSIDTLEVFP